MGAECARAAGAGSAGPLQRARVRADHRRADRQTRRAHRADVLPALRRQARGAVRGSHALEEIFVDTLAGTPDSIAPIDAMASTLETVAAFFLERHEFARQRQAVIMANAELRERELIKLASLSAALAATLRPARRQGPGREPRRGGGYRRLQGRVRALGRRQRGTYPGGLPSGVARRTQSGGRGRVTAGPVRAAGRCRSVRERLVEPRSSGRG